MDATDNAMIFNDRLDLNIFKYQNYHDLLSYES